MRRAALRQTRARIASDPARRPEARATAPPPARAARRGDGGSGAEAAPPGRRASGRGRPARAATPRRPAARSCRSRAPAAWREARLHGIDDEQRLAALDCGVDREGRRPRRSAAPRAWRAAPAAWRLHAGAPACRGRTAADGAHHSGCSSHRGASPAARRDAAAPERHVQEHPGGRDDERQEQERAVDEEHERDEDGEDDGPKARISSRGGACAAPALVRSAGICAVFQRRPHAHAQRLAVRDASILAALARDPDRRRLRHRLGFYGAAPHAPSCLEGNAIAPMLNPSRDAVIRRACARPRAIRPRRSMVAEAVVEERQLLKRLRWYDGFVSPSRRRGSCSARSATPSATSAAGDRSCCGDLRRRSRFHHDPLQRDGRDVPGQAGRLPAVRARGLAEALRRWSAPSRRSATGSAGRSCCRSWASSSARSSRARGSRASPRARRCPEDNYFQLSTSASGCRT